jgi:hypothetical protein
MGVVRYSCAVEGYEDSWVELDTRWTRADETRVLALRLKTEALDMLRAKCKAVHLVDGTRVYNDPAQLTNEEMESIDLILWGFVTSIVLIQYKEMQAITDFATRVSPPTSEKTS